MQTESTSCNLNFVLPLRPYRSWRQLENQALRWFCSNPFITSIGPPYKHRYLNDKSTLLYIHALPPHLFRQLYIYINNNNKVTCSHWLTEDRHTVNVLLPTTDIGIYSISIILWKRLILNSPNKCLNLKRFNSFSIWRSLTGVFFSAIGKFPPHSGVWNNWWIPPPPTSYEGRKRVNKYR